jgi:hypothetical protein
MTRLLEAEVKQFESNLDSKRFSKQQFLGSSPSIRLCPEISD